MSHIYAAGDEVKSDALNLTGVAYFADSGAADAYVIAPTIDGAAAYGSLTTGMRFSFIAANANTGSSTLQVNSVAAKTIKKSVSTNLQAGDIKAGQAVLVEYDGTNFQMLSIPGGVISSADITDLTDGGSTTLHYHAKATGTTSRSTSSGTGTFTIAHGLGATPRIVRLYTTAGLVSNVNGCLSIGSGTSSSDDCCVYFGLLSGGGSANAELGTNASIARLDAPNTTAQVIIDLSSLDSTNITLNASTVTNGGSDWTYYMKWEAEL